MLRELVEEVENFLLVKLDWWRVVLHIIHVVLHLDV